MQQLQTIDQHVAITHDLVQVGMEDAVFFAKLRLESPKSLNT